MKDHYPSDEIEELIAEGSLKIFVIQSTPAALSTAFSRAVAESPSIDIYLHEPFAGLQIQEHFSPLKKGECFQHKCDEVLGEIYKVIDEKGSCSVVIKTMANDIADGAAGWLMGVSEGATTLARNPLSQLRSYMNTYGALNENSRPDVKSLQSEPGLREVFGDRLDEMKFARRLFKFFNTPEYDAMNKVASLSKSYGYDDDEIAWQSLSDNLAIVDKSEKPHVTVQSELLASADTCEIVMRKLCNTWGVEYSQSMIAEHSEHGKDNWSKTKDPDIYRSERDGFFVKKATSAKGWRFGSLDVPEISILPPVLQDYALHCAARVYLMCATRDDHVGPRTKQMMDASYGERFAEATKALDELEPTREGERLKTLEDSFYDLVRPSDELILFAEKIGISEFVPGASR